MFNYLILCKNVRNARLRIERINKEFIDEKEEGKERRKKRRKEVQGKTFWLARLSLKSSPMLEKGRKSRHRQIPIF